MACPWARYLSRDVLSNAHFLCDTAAGLRDTRQRISPTSRYRLWSYTCLREMHTELPSKQADPDDACSGGFYFFLPSGYNFSCNTRCLQGRGKCVVSSDTVRVTKFYACLLPILLFRVMALPSSSPVCYLCKGILKLSHYLTSNDGLLNNELQAMRKDALVA